MQNFAVKQRYGSFNAVAGDMKLVQIIQQSQKGTGGIIGKTRQSECHQTGDCLSRNPFIIKYI